MKVPFVCLVWYAGVFVDVPSVVSRDAGQAQLNPSAALAGACSARVLASLLRLLTTRSLHCLWIMPRNKQVSCSH